MANPTIGFIGYGNMAQAIAEGLVNAGVVNGGDIVACAAHYDKLERNAAKLGAKAVRTAAQVAEAADMVVIAIKPYQIETVIAPIIDQLAQENTIVVSIAAGWDLNKFRDLFGTSFEQAHIQCTIPNTPMAVGKGVLVTEIDNTLTQEQTETFESLFSSISLIERVDTAHMGIGMCIAGCAPAFTDMYIEALGDAGVKYGLQRATAYRLAAKMRGRALFGQRNASGCHEGRCLLSGRHHHQGCRIVGGKRVPWCRYQSSRRHRSLILS